jgi:hypothetical protein
MVADTLIQVGSTTVELEGETWEKHGRDRFEILILCSDYPYSSYDGIRDIRPSLADVREALDWIIKNEGQKKLVGYTDEQVEVLKKRIHELIDEIH